jgi:Smg protein
MFDVIVYLFEHYFEADVYPDEGTLTRELSAAGFDSEEIHQAIAWMNGVEDLARSNYPDTLAESRSVRCYGEQEEAKISPENRGFLMFLEASGVLNAVQREWVIDRVMALNEAEVTLEQVKWTVLIVLWSQGQGQDYLFIEDLLFGDNKAMVH